MNGLRPISSTIAHRNPVHRRRVRHWEDLVTMDVAMSLLVTMVVVAVCLAVGFAMMEP